MRKFLLPLLFCTLSFGAVEAKGLPSPFTPFTAPTKAVKGNLTTITIADLQNALTMSNAVPGANLPTGETQPAPYNATVTGGDTRHGNCWAALIQFAGGIQAQNLLPNQLGIATAMQTMFNDQQLAGRPLIPDYVAMNCVLAFNDAGQTLNTIITGLGLKAITLPAIP